jgi:hypothetical protein
MSDTAKDFLTRCFAPGETLALLLRSESADRPAQRIVRLEQAIAPAFLRWLAHENHAADAVPSPTAILATSSGKYQALWRVDGFDFERQETMLKLLALAFGGDSACTDCNRVLRIPGFLNCKYSPAHRVTVEYPCDSVWNPGNFRLDIAALPFRGIARPMQPGKHTHSEQDWAWVLSELSDGKDAEKLTHALASRRADKPNPVYYAQRTVDMASARLWLEEGAPIDDVITMLVVRRRFEVPDALCSARAREIATTAQRMIARKKIA